MKKEERMNLYCFNEKRRTEHTKKIDLRYYCVNCGYTNGMIYSSLGNDSR